MRTEAIADLSRLPRHGLGSASLSWWGTLAFMLIEGTAFAMGIGTYLYLVSVAPEWPMAADPPDPWPSIGITAVLLASVAPNILLARWARAQDLRRVRIGLLVMVAFGAAPLPLRAWEFALLGIAWDSNAYGSITWLMLGLHTTHLLTDLAETAVLAVLMFTRHADNPRRFGDVGDNAMYWHFVVFSWLPIQACLYLVPRLG